MNNVAMVTGGARRIGRAIASHLHTIGFDIALHYRSSSESAQALAEELCGKRPDSCRLFQADLQDEMQISALASEVLACSPSIELLVNNASSYSPSPIQTCTPEQFDSLLGANLRGPYFLIQALLSRMRSGTASIVNILDIHMDIPLRDFNAYGASKAGLASLTRSLAVDLGPDIRVNGVAPGAILWPEDDDSYDDDMREHTVQQTPLKRLGDPMDIARTVGFLACDAPFITGQIITVDGGRSLVS
ncbi:3-oxoacyl-[acyl-carrier-protein] reductase FabG [Halioglobus japonicus]|nr:3-oxoacyl-[acyl-carrier-protein] reductase FabG [Halioglobus japonicus]